MTISPWMASERTVSAVKDLEGYREFGYQDLGGVWTVGYGITHMDQPITAQTRMSQRIAELLLRGELSMIGTRLAELVPVDLTQGQIDALISLEYNTGALERSNCSILPDIKAGEFQKAADTILLWNEVDGKPCEGLEKRRAVERAWFLEAA